MLKINKSAKKRGKNGQKLGRRPSWKMAAIEKMYFKRK